jgi:Domain of unknown function (DUF4062)
VRGRSNEVECLLPNVRPEPVEGSAERRFAFATSALYGRARPVTFGIAPKVTKNASPCTPLLPPVLATGGMRQRHTKASLTLRTVCARGRIYDRPLLRSSARAEGAQLISKAVRTANNSEATLKRKFQVFISSTFTDLIAERQAAVAAVLKASHIPAGMELFTAGDRSQMTTIKEWIDQSDVYMLMLGGRYGSVEKTSGVSYTELEFDYALQQGKPVFAVVISDAALEAKVKSGGTAFMEKDNPKELALFRAKVLNNISSFFDDHKDIKLCVHESLADFAGNRDLKGWVSGDEVVDTIPLFEEIKKLSDENKTLKETVSRMEVRLAAAVSSPPDGTKDRFLELRKLFKGIDVKIPAALNDEGNEITITLLDLFFGNRDVLVTGVTNSVNASPAEIFYYSNVCPKLQVHGLVVNEKVPSTRYRRSCVSSLGHAFLADIERSTLAAKQEKPKVESKVMDP